MYSLLPFEIRLIGDARIKWDVMATYFIVIGGVDGFRTREIVERARVRERERREERESERRESEDNVT